MQPLLEPITHSLNYPDLPETWRVPEDGYFSVEKTLYDYQTDALRKAARALFLYYEKDYDWAADEPQGVNIERKQSFADRYGNLGIGDLSLRKYESTADERNNKESQVFRILSEFLPPQGDLIPYYNLINRMCFWMATGSGKTLVMVKLIEYLHSLQRHGEIPPHNMLILAPSDHLIGQIRRTVEEFNQTGLYIDLVPLREIHHERQAQFNAVTVYYHRSDNISDVQKDALTDYRTYENDGKWYVFLDEAHKGSKEDSKRQAYYAVMARQGFLFNFSATFTDAEDIVTTVKKYNLAEFIKNGHGKNIYLNEEEYDAFRKNREEISPEERQKIVLKSLITLAYVSLRVNELRMNTSLANLYHQPMMLTLVNSVNTVKNDLWMFFQTLRDIATDEIDSQLFEDSKSDLIDDWGNAGLLFGQDGGGIIGTDESLVRAMTIDDLREAVFLSQNKGALQVIRSIDNKELAFQMRNADSPFALIRIGDTRQWRNELLAGYEETTALQEESFFSGLEQSQITILMGSRSFFESWDSNRPNVINFINIGGTDAKKFVVQSVGRGVRIETLPGKRRRYAFLSGNNGETALQAYHDQVQPPETLFLFATNRNAVKAVLEGLETEKGEIFEKLKGFEKADRPEVDGQEMPLLIPEYQEIVKDSISTQFSMSNDTLQRFKEWLKRTSDSVFAVRDGLTSSQIVSLRGMAEQGGGVQIRSEKDYAMLPFLQGRLVSHLSKKVKVADGVRELGDEDIVHFREIRVHTEYVTELQEKIDQVKQGAVSDEEIPELAIQLKRGDISREEFHKRYSGKNEADFKELEIKKLLGHYYLPVVLGNEKANYIQHIIKVPSEIEFLNALETWVGKHKDDMPCDAWMFSKIDESLDVVHIPYYDHDKNEYRRFLPDFVFWICRENEYRIVFVDPKGEAHTSSYHKIDGYKKLFVEDSGVRSFSHGKWKVSVDLLLYNPGIDPLKPYKNYWISDPGDIFLGKDKP